MYFVLFNLEYELSFFEEVVVFYFWRFNNLGGLKVRIFLVLL